MSTRKLSAKDNELSVLQRMFSASLGASFAALVVTPLDVAKTRMQTQIPDAVEQVLRFRNGTDALFKIARHEGVTALWRGLRTTIVLSVPSTVAYLSVYDILRQKLQHYGSSKGTASLWSGVISRAAAGALVSPLELVRTAEFAATGKDRPLRLSALLRYEYNRPGGIVNLYRGLVPSLLRDVPFSGIYWPLYEVLKDYGLNTLVGHDGLPTQSDMFITSMFGGAFSGMVASAVTHPLDVIKTRAQVESYDPEARVSHERFGLAPEPTSEGKVGKHSGRRGYMAGNALSRVSNQLFTRCGSVRCVARNVHFCPSCRGRAMYSSQSMRPASCDASVLNVARRIWTQEGWAGLYLGFAFRVVKIMPACAITISTYEACKLFFINEAE